MDKPENCAECGRHLRYETLPALFGRQPFEIRIKCQCEEEWEAAEEEMRRRAHIRDLRKNSGMPMEQQDCRLFNFEQRSGVKKIYQSCVRYVSGFDEYRKSGRGILFAGSVGSGKTHLAAAIANELIDREIAVKFVSVTDLLTQIKSTYNSWNESEDEIMRPLKNCPLLILDDLGSEKPSDWTKTQFHGLIDYRYSNYRPTIITTNLKPDELGGVLDPRTIDRIMDRHKERFTLLAMNAPSYRTG